MAKPELGTKRTCPSCGTKYYDLQRDPIVCPSCGTVFELATPQRPERPPETKAAEEAEGATEVERDEGVVSLEEAEGDNEEEDVGPDSDNEEEEPDIPDVEVDEEIDENSSDEDTFLEEDEEGGEDVSGLLDVDAEDEDER